jgi:hypothetical protein
MDTVAVDAAAIEPEPLATLYHYWLSVKGGRRIPRRIDLDPTEFAFCLGHVALADIETPFRVRYRLVGTNLVQLYGSELQGCYVDQLYSPAVRREALNAYRTVVETASPRFKTISFNLILRRYGYHRLMLPLAFRSEGEVDMVMVGVYPLHRTLKSAEQWRDLERFEADQASGVRIVRRVGKA